MASSPTSMKWSSPSVHILVVFLMVSIALQFAVGNAPISTVTAAVEVSRTTDESNATLHPATDYSSPAGLKLTTSSNVTSGEADLTTIPTLTGSEATLTEGFTFTGSETTITAVPTVTEQTPTTSAAPIVINGTTVVTRCSQNVTLPVLSQPVTTLVLDLGESAVGKEASCSWFIPPPDQDTSNIFVFPTTSNSSACGKNGVPREVVELFYVDSFVGEMTLGDSCSSQGWNVTGVQGEPMLLKFTSRNVTKKTITIGTYSSFTWPDTLCTNGSRVMTANVSSQEVVFPGHGVLIPPGMQCTWSFRPLQEDGEVTIHINSHQKDMGFFCDVNGLVEIDDEGSETSDSINYSSCKYFHDFGYTSFGNVLSVTVLTMNRDAPGFTITYQAAPIENVCPTSPLHLSALPNQGRYFKGVNRVNKSNTEQECLWEISSPSLDMVIRLDEFLTQIYHDNYVCKSHDTVTLEDGQILSMCDNNRFPYWSENQTTLLRYRATSGSRGGRFLIQYTAVSKSECQGHPITLSVTAHAQITTGNGLPLNETSDNTDCRWLLRASDSEMAVHAMVTLSTPPYDRCYVDAVRAYDGSLVKDTYLVPDCPLGDQGRTLVYTSNSDRMLLTFDRGYRLRQLPLNLKIQYQEVTRPTSTPTGAAGRLVTLGPLWVLLISFMSCL